MIIGLTSFGGYTALVSMIQKRMVKEGYVEDKMIFDGVTIASFLPGPLAVNIVTSIGYQLRGVGGAMVSFVSILLPSCIFMVAMAAFHDVVSQKESIETVIRYVNPVIAAIVLQVAMNMFRKNVVLGWQRLLLLGFLVVVIWQNGFLVFIVSLLAGGLVGFLMRERNEQSNAVAPDTSNRRINPLIALTTVFMAVGIVIFLFAPSIHASLLLVFGKMSLTLFGGGYVMIPIMHHIIVDQLTWLTDQEFALAIAYGQVTPGPILVSATFIGYKLAGISGGIVATLSIFLPSAILMLFVSRAYVQFEQSSIVKAVNQGFKPVIVAFIGYSGYLILGAYEIDWISLAIMGVSFGLLFFTKINFFYLIGIAGAIGLLFG